MAQMERKGFLSHRKNNMRLIIKIVVIFDKC